MFEEAAVYLLLLHSPEGTEVRLNPLQVTSMHSPRRDPQTKLYHEKANCLVGLADGKSIAVAETCHEVERLLEEAK